jgi:hypothetical protein
MEDHDEPVMGGGVRTVKKAVPLPQRIRLYGSRAPYGQMPKVPVVGGFALNAGIDADFMQKWLEQNPDNDFVLAGLLKVFPEDATGRAPKAEGYAKEAKEIKNGLEPADPKNLPKGIVPFKLDDAA